jgi:hypothetical protein
MPVNSTHPDYDTSLPIWIRARDVIAGEDAIKAAGISYLPRLESQTDDEYLAYKSRASFFNATARTADAYVGLMFRRLPFIKLPDVSTALGKALADFNNDADMLGTPLGSYARNVVTEVIAVGRAGTLVDWEDEAEQRVYASLYAAEDILNWRVERVNGRNILTMLVLRECGKCAASADASVDEYAAEPIEQIRVLKLVGSGKRGKGAVALQCQVEIWQPKAQKKKGEKVEWALVETRTPLRLGKALPLIPFVFHGPHHSKSCVDKVPMSDIITVNLDHYRLDADYKHGMHFTALPTAWVSGFDKESTLRIGSSAAWVTETPGATAGFLEYTGQGLTSFERALDRDERLLAVLGSRLLESQKRVGESAQAIELHQSGENSILGHIAISLSASLSQVLRWAYWWNSTEELPDDVTHEQGLIQLSTDFSLRGLSAQEITAIVAAWQSGALSQDSMLDLFRRGEVLPEGRSNDEEVKLLSDSRVVTS